jgi:hypothetical protein
MKARDTDRPENGNIGKKISIYTEQQAASGDLCEQTTQPIVPQASQPQQPATESL